MICPNCKGEGKTRGLDSGTISDCGRCNGTGKIKPKNYERITESPQKLAEFIYCLIENIDNCAGNMPSLLEYAMHDAVDKQHVELIRGNRDFDEVTHWLGQEANHDIQ